MGFSGGPHVDSDGGLLWWTPPMWLWEKTLCTEVGTSVGLAWVCVRPPAWQKERGHEQETGVGLAWV